MIICCGEALIDMVPEKNKSGVDVYCPCFGGSPYNTAVAAGRILQSENGRARTAYLSRISRDFFGEALCANLEANHVSTSLVSRAADHTTLAFVKLKDGREPEYAFYTEGSADRNMTESDFPGQLPGDVSCIAFGSISLTMEPSARAIESFIARVAAGGAQPGNGRPVISLDPNVRPMMIKDRDAYVSRFEKWVSTSDIVKISEADFEYIYPSLSRDDAMKKLLDLGAALVLCTLGKNGAMAISAAEGSNAGAVIRVPGAALRPAAPGEIPDTIGAGDTFHGAFLAKLEMDSLLRCAGSKFAVPDETRLAQAMNFACGAAAIVCSRKGANPPWPEEL